MEFQIAIAKVDRYSSNEEGDKVEVIERPLGGLSIILAEGKLNGRRSKAVALKAVHKLLTLISEGIHDGASSRAVLTNLNNEHGGNAELNLSVISCDLVSQTLVITKNNQLPVALIRDEKIDYLRIEDEECNLALTPKVFQFQLEEGMTLVICSDGIFRAGCQNNQPFNLTLNLEALFEDDEPSVRVLADYLLTQAISQDIGRPHDDMSVIVLRTADKGSQGIRRVDIQFPITIN
jgi:serine phosphatase RsbU (regulator of sigma subunit)